jgi:hypothetical protein
MTSAFSSSQNKNVEVSSISASDIPIGPIVGIIVGVIVCIALCTLMYYCCTLYCFYISDPKSRPQFLYTHNVEERDCGTMACINLNKQLILCCCPSLEATVKKTDLYQDVTFSTNVTHTASHFPPLGLVEMHPLLQQYHAHNMIQVV